VWWIIIGVVAVVVAIVALVVRSSRAGGDASDALSAINQWYDGILDQRTTERAAHDDPESIRALVNEFSDGDYDGSWEASEALAKIGPKVVPYLVDLVSVAGSRGFWAIETLEKIGRGSKPALPALQKVANDPDQTEERRQSARIAIGKIR